MTRIIIIFILSGCISGPLTAQQKPRVIIHGSLRGIMNNDLEEKIRLTTVPDNEHIYGLGAAADLDGEIIILNDRIYHTSVRNGQPVTTTDEDSGAALLVYTSVSSWLEEPLPDSVRKLTDLENYLERFASASPFAFRLTGIPESVAWHVISWDPADSEHSHAKHKSAGISGTTDEPGEVTILGFFSNRHQGIFTHHSTSLHLHILFNDYVAHIDDLVLSQDIKLQLPDYILVK